MKIAMIVGSRRAHSFNGQLAALATKALKQKAETTIIEWKDVPFFDQDEEFPVPESVQRIREQIGECDGVWLFTPEYNGQIPGGEKNLLDWLSRGEKPGQRKTVMTGMPAAISSVGGRMGGANSAKLLERLLAVMGMKVMPDMTTISLAPASWQSDDLADTPDVQNKIDVQAEMFIAWIKENRKEKTE